jgi:hypothetical protein
LHLKHGIVAFYPSEIVAEQRADRRLMVPIGAALCVLVIVIYIYKCEIFFFEFFCQKNVGCYIAEHKSEHFLLVVFLKTEDWGRGFYVDLFYCWVNTVNTCTVRSRFIPGLNS